MKILIILPNWLGDAIMATPAIEAVFQKHPNASFTFIGSFVSIEALKYHPNCIKTYVDPTKKSKNRFSSTYKFAKELGQFDIVISFRDNIFSAMLLYFTRSKIRLLKKSWFSRLLATGDADFVPNEHLVLSYLRIVSSITNANPIVGNLKLYIPKISLPNKTLGINPGATYGSAKRWLPERFAQVAKAFSGDFDIIIFGGPNEVDTGKEIAYVLDALGVKNYTNLAGKTTIETLCSTIGGLTFFLTNDSGPMHVAAAYQIPTVAIFGPTRYLETSQWQNKHALIVRHELSCAPCMKRTCPLKHHECMTGITAEEVIEEVKRLRLNVQQEAQ